MPQSFVNDIDSGATFSTCVFWGSEWGLRTPGFQDSFSEHVTSLARVRDTVSVKCARTWTRSLSYGCVLFTLAPIN